MRPPATAAVAPTIFADKQGFAVRITLKGADGAIITSKETRTKRESGGCCGPPLECPYIATSVAERRRVELLLRC